MSDCERRKEIGISMSDFRSDRKYQVEQQRHLPFVPQVESSTIGVEEKEQQKMKDQAIKLREVLAEMPTSVMEELGVKAFNVLTVTNSDERSVTRYPFLGIYIEACLRSDNAIKESEMRNAIEKAIGEKLSCTCSPEMSGCQKAVYRVDFEMHGVA